MSSLLKKIPQSAGSSLWTCSGFPLSCILLARIYASLRKAPLVGTKSLSGTRLLNVPRAFLRMPPGHSVIVRTLGERVSGTSAHL